MHRSRSLIHRAARRTLSTDSSSKKTLSSKNDLQAVYPYKLLYHHKQPTLFPSRHPGSFTYTLHHISSSFNALVSLCASQESRDQYLALTQPPSDDDDDESNDISDEHHGFNGTIINTSILGQSDMGFMKVLSLFEDLKGDQILEEYNLNETMMEDVRGLMMGCGWALEHFHLAKDELLDKMLTETSSGVDLESDDKMDEDDVITADLDEKKSPTITVNGQEMQLNSPNPNYDFLEIAKDDPDSIEHTVISMTTPEMLEMIRMEGIMKLIMGNIAGVGGEGADGKASNALPLAIMRNNSDLDQLKEFYQKSKKITQIKEDTRVMNVALLSARVEEIYPGEVELSEEIGRTRQSEDPNAPLEDDSFVENNPDSNAQVVTQLEVLYELQQSSMNDDGKKHTQTSVMVGKFEACLKGDPNGDGLRWRLCSYRPAVEFGYFNTW